MKTQRDYNIDLLRILACFMIVVLHVSSQNWYDTPITSFEWKSFTFYDSAVRCATPLFFMISGKLFLSRSKLDIKKLLLKNTAKLVFIYFLWSFLYAVDKIGLKSVLELRFGDLLAAILQSRGHLWFLQSMVSVYLLMPIIFAIKDLEQGKYLKYILILFFVFEILRTSILALFPSSSLNSLLYKFDSPLEAYSGYFILGYVMSEKANTFENLKKRYLLLAFLGAVAVTAFLTVRFSLAQDGLYEALFDKFFITTFAEACILFAVFLKLPGIRLSDRMAGFVSHVSKYTLFIFLAHHYVLEHLNLLFGINTLSFTPLFSVPILAIGIFGICLLIAFIIGRIPVLNKILV